LTARITASIDVASSLIATRWASLCMGHHKNPMRRDRATAKLGDASVAAPGHGAHTKYPTSRPTKNPENASAPNPIT
jgi:hypothetical protein